MSWEGMMFEISCYLVKMLKNCLLLTNGTLNINLYDCLRCLALPLFTHTNLVNISTNIDILMLIWPLQYLVFAPGAPIQINMVISKGCHRLSHVHLNISLNTPMKYESFSYTHLERLTCATWDTWTQITPENYC